MEIPKRSAMTRFQFARSIHLIMFLPISTNFCVYAYARRIRIFINHLNNTKLKLFIRDIVVVNWLWKL